MPTPATGLVWSTRCALDDDTVRAGSEGYVLVSVLVWVRIHRSPGVIEPTFGVRGDEVDVTDGDPHIWSFLDAINMDVDGCEEMGRERIDRRRRKRFRAAHPAHDRSPNATRRAREDFKNLFTISSVTYFRPCV